jgi:hypothetical protein
MSSPEALMHVHAKGMRTHCIDQQNLEPSAKFAFKSAGQLRSLGSFTNSEMNA